jgi:hypothetical protein
MSGPISFLNFKEIVLTRCRFYLSHDIQWQIP